MSTFREWVLPTQVHIAVHSKFSRGFLIGSGHTAQPCIKTPHFIPRVEHRKTKAYLLAQG